jgi:hypothetical protein
MSDFFLSRRYFDREFAIRSSTSAWHGWSSAHQQARSLRERHAFTLVEFEVIKSNGLNLIFVCY